MPQTTVIAFCRVCLRYSTIKTAYPQSVETSDSAVDFAIPCDACRARIYPGLEATQ